MSRQSPSPSVHSLRNGINREQSLLQLNGCSPVIYSPTPRTTTGESLGALVGASLTVVDNTIYTFAGFDQYTDEVYNSLHQLTFNDNQEECIWKRVVYTKGRPPAKRNDHSATLWGNNNKLVIYGGSAEEDEKYYNDIAILDLNTMTWEYPTTFGNQPEGRIRHSATIYNNKLYIAGGIISPSSASSVSSSSVGASNLGQTGQQQHPDTLLILDLTTWIWQDPIPFVKRSQHITFVYNDRLYLFGGLHEDMTRSNYLSFIDISDDPFNDSTVTHIDINSPKAPSLTAQRFLQICGDKLVVIVTPSISQPSCLSDVISGVWTLNLESLQWRCHQVGTSFGTCHWHSFAMAEHSTQLYLFGTEDELPDEYYSKVICLDLKELGIIPIPQPQLGTDLAQLLQLDFIKPDFILRSSIDSEGDDIYVHKLILLARWHHFHNSMKAALELDGNQVMDMLTLPYSLPVLRGFVDYLYKDTLQQLPLMMICDLLMMANEYSMDRLMALCVQRLYMHMDVNSVSKVYYVARQTKQQGLQHQALQYIFEHFGAVSHSEGFRNLPRDLLLQILDEMPKNAAIVAHGVVPMMTGSLSNGVGGFTIMQTQRNGSDSGLYRQQRYGMTFDDDGDNGEDDDDDADDAMET
ncbi:uncharacterized protein BX664DRAFT_357407 [Halteromyces radiatus]|uniref:uncharacterized protein n=1 Tax=Halteromyces radiatus TaxID=101107 RepID=UPI00222071ED|nr:uncharacterized protein BX664DRAFT_357407 [Halteromyces radiatus]KAI8092919.1 hypothetical protein BX664DRAFT_357407 [Halteromyces radiatus]